MDQLGVSKFRLATTGLNPCIGFVVFLNDGEDILIEHLTDLRLPGTMNLNKVREVFEDITMTRYHMEISCMFTQ